MADYRSRLESKLKALESKIKPLEEERNRLMAALSVLKELDLEDTQGKSPENAGASKGTLIDAAAKVLESSDEMMTTREIEDRLKQDRIVSKGTVYVALSRLKDRGVVIREGRYWGWAE